MRRAILPLAVLAAGLGLAGCTQGARSGRRLELPPVPDPLPMTVTPAPAPKPLTALPSGPEKIPGSPSVRVVWEALFVERDRYANPSPEALRRGARPFVDPKDLEIVLLNASFAPTPDQEREHKSRPPTGRIARIADADMNAVWTALEQIGFFRHARPTGSLRALFGSDRARGRVTVDRGDESWTLLSMRGLGLQAETREVPAIYAAAKEVVSRMKNSASSLRVTGERIREDDARRPGEGLTSPAGR
jgi:hypothetical protein